MNINYNHLTTIFRSILTQIYVFLVIFTIFHFDLEKFISKNCKYIFFYQKFVDLGENSIQEKFMQVRSFERYIPLRQVLL